MFSFVSVSEKHISKKQVSKIETEKKYQTALKNLVDADGKDEIEGVSIKQMAEGVPANHYWWLEFFRDSDGIRTLISLIAIER